MKIRKSAERGHFDHGWLKTYHTFSFSEYYDPQFMEFHDLRVLNEDFVAPGKGFPTHGHKDFEILTWILSGQLQHRDSMGNTSIIKPGEAQRMSAGTGVTHSEFNPSADESVHLLQIWIQPAEKGLAPSYEQKYFDRSLRDGKWCLIASPDARDGSIVIHQDVLISVANIDIGQTIEIKNAESRNVCMHIARGEVLINDQLMLQAGDALALEEKASLRIMALAPAEVIVFDLRG